MDDALLLAALAARYLPIAEDGFLGRRFSRHRPIDLSVCCARNVAVDEQQGAHIQIIDRRMGDNWIHGVVSSLRVTDIGQ